jgi:replicative DNA helicase
LKEDNKDNVDLSTLEDDLDFSQLSNSMAPEEDPTLTRNNTSRNDSGSKLVDRRVPPQNIEAEECLLGAMMLSRDAVTDGVEAKVDPADFYKPIHSHIFEAIMNLFQEGDAVDVVTVAERLRRNKKLDYVGGKQALIRIQSTPPASVNAMHYGKIVKDLAMLRRLIGVSQKIGEMAFEPTNNVAQVLDQAESIVFDVAQKRVGETLVNLDESLKGTLEHLESMYGRENEVTGISTGFVDLDDLLLGMQRNALYIVAARPAMGKTAFALGIASNIAIREKKPVLFFSMEMGHLELTKRILAAEAQIEARRLWTGNLTDDDWASLGKEVGELAEAPFFIDDDPRCTVMEMRAKARRMKARYGDLGCIVVDYIQLMSSPGFNESRQLEVSEMSRGLKILARELEVPVVALSQLNRQLEYRQEKRPMLADLRESGSLEQDADVVMFLYRDEVYNPDTDLKGIAEVIIAKHRNGPTGMCQLAFMDRQTRFANMAKMD